MTPYEIICQELASEISINGELTPPPYNENANEIDKLTITYRYLLRAQRVKQRKKALVYAYYLGKIIEANNLPIRTPKQIISEHYYQTSIRVYYIFELNPHQIEQTTSITLSLIRKLTSVEYRSLVIEL